MHTHNESKQRCRFHIKHCRSLNKIPPNRHIQHINRVHCARKNATIFASQICQNNGLQHRYTLHITHTHTHNSEVQPEKKKQTNKLHLIKAKFQNLF